LPGWHQRLEQAYSLRLLGHPPAGEDAETGEGEEAEQPSPDSQGHLLDPDQGVDRALDALPGKAARVLGHEGRSLCGVRQLQVRR
jgi:hypothetical protein